MRPRNSGDYSAIDLFAGCGGLTVGLKRAGFRVSHAIELDKHACSTYKVNHPEVRMLQQDIRTVATPEMSDADGPDLVAGCPPCQGFSSLTSKWHRRDPRNSLVGEMGRFVEDLRPRVVMMENVPGVATKGRHLLNRLIRKLERLGYSVEWGVLQVADYGVPQLRKRFVLLAGKGFRIPLPAPTHSRDGSGGLLRWRTVGDAIRDQCEPTRYDKLSLVGGPLAVDWHVVRVLSAENERRLRHAVPGDGWTRIPKRLRPACHQKPTAGFRNAYGRMRWDEPSPTITGGCVTLSKGRFGHPEAQRTISIREAALLQTFPPGYVFDCGYVEHVAAMIGNALPCDFAEVVARQCFGVLAQASARSMPQGSGV